MKIHITGHYLWVPIDKEGKVYKLHFYFGDTRFQELDIALGTDHAAFYAAMDVSRYLGQDIVISGDISDSDACGIKCSDDMPENKIGDRPLLHFTPPAGWMNDPNGLIFDGEYYHLYYQWNPYGIGWGNMHWGHAVSRDLIQWEHLPAAMEPDEYGTVYSGSAIMDNDNAAGFGKGAILYFYTASGGRTIWSEENGHTHTQRLSVSTDGNTLEKKGLVISNIKKENRDPKVFFHKESHAYVMVLYLDENEFAIFRSEDLLCWKETQRLSLERMWECPDLFRLDADDNGKTEKWIFWSADGFYVIGSFDGFRFMAESEILKAYDTELPYAAQTFSGIKDRTISIAWLRTSDVSGNFCGMMSVPAEISLKHLDNGYRIAFRPVKELWKHLKSIQMVISEKERTEIALEGQPVILQIKWSGSGTGCIKADMKEIIIRKAVGITTLVVDRGIIEYFSDGGLIYGSVEVEKDVLHHKLWIEQGYEMNAETTIRNH